MVRILWDPQLSFFKKEYLWPNVRASVFEQNVTFVNILNDYLLND